MSLMMVSLVFHTATQSICAQDMDVLLNQLQGKVEAPQRNAEQLAQAYEKAIDYLLPLMSADDIGSRYQHQITLQDMGSHASRPGAETERRILASVLCRKIEAAEMPSTVRNWFVLQVERIGKDESVETLMNLLSSNDKELRDYARRALVKNPSQAALRSLERALKQAEDSEWKNTLLQSLAERSRTDAAGGSAAALEKAAAIITDSLKKSDSAAGAPAGTSGVPDVMTPSEAAAYLKVAEEDVVAAIEAGDITAKKIGKAYRISKEALDEFLSS